MTLLIQKPTGAKLVLAKDFISVDPDFASVSLLLHGDGTNGSTTITDSSPTPKTVTAVGDAQISTAQSKFGESSLLIDGTGDRLDSSNSADFTFGTQNYTIEGWLFQSTFSTNALVDFREDGTAIAIYSSISTDRKLTVTSNTAVILSSSILFSANTWMHWAVSREASTIRTFVGGTLAGSVTDTRNYTSTTCRIGQSSAGQDFNGYIDDLRITKGIARYSGNFTPPTAPFPDIASR
jgi:hypothetical protein